MSWDPRATAARADRAWSSTRRRARRQIAAGAEVGL